MRDALHRTFETRATHVLPLSFPAPPTEWEAPFRRLAKDLSVPTNLQEAYRMAAAFLNPVLDGDVDKEARWDPGLQTWIE